MQFNDQHLFHQKSLVLFCSLWDLLKDLQFTPPASMFDVIYIKYVQIQLSHDNDTQLFSACKPFLYVAVHWPPKQLPAVVGVQCFTIYAMLHSVDTARSHGFLY